MMKLKNLFPVLLFMVVVLPLQLSSQSIQIQQNNGQIHNELLSNVQNLHFNPGELVLQSRSGTNTSFALANIKKITFDTETGIAEKHLQSLEVMPSPVQTILFLKGVPKTARKAVIYNSNGVLTMEKEIVMPAKSLDVSMLSSGLYILNINGQTVKFVKQ